MLLTMGVRAVGLVAPDGVDKCYPFIGRVWDLSSKGDQQSMQALVLELDPIIVHGGVPCEKFSQMGLHPGQQGFDQAAYDSAVGAAEFFVTVVEGRLLAGGGGSLESPLPSRLWKLPVVVALFGTEVEPKPNRFFSDTDLCMHGLVDPAEPHLRYRKAVTLAA